MSRPAKKIFTPELIDECVQMIVREGHTYRKVCEDKEVSKTTLEGWVRKFRREQGQEIPDKKAQAKQHQLFKDLEKTNRDLMDEVKRLKSIIALLAVQAKLT
ncbi:transposase [Pantoea dispersa]|uniref:transposase n=1 Tax=Pantoea dispersa TaxID=59814 RepID=UPI001BA5DD40|nr:transposase [Pantoea dispersa]MBS0904946.1 transposase [Pantoea dispersa]